MIAFPTKLLRRHWCIALIFLCSVCYFLAHLFQLQFSLRIVGSKSSIHEEFPAQLIGRKTFLFSNVLEVGNSSDSASEVTGCRNSIQGKVLLVDERGFVCRREFVQHTGCCPDPVHHSANVSNSSALSVPHSNNLDSRYSCRTCSAPPPEGEGAGPGRCCAVFEYCVACCLAPASRAARSPQPVPLPHSLATLYAAARDHFELCMIKCRTSSLSVLHENAYRDASQKHCFDVGPQAAGQKGEKSRDKSLTQ